MTQGCQGIAREESEVIQDSPLSTNIVGLESENAWNIGVCSSNCQEYAEVACTKVFCEAKQRKADQTQTALEHDEGASKMVFITKDLAIIDYD